MRIVVGLLVTLAGCAGGGSDNDKPDGGGSGSGDGGGSGSNYYDSGNLPGYCSDPAKLVYTLEANKRVSKFDPSTGTFTQVGYINCPGQDAFFGPFSMGLDRDGAWVLYRDYTDPQIAPTLFRVDLTTLACTASSWTSHNGLRVFTMGTSTDVEGGDTDTFYLAGNASNLPSNTTTKLASMSTATLGTTTIGNLPSWAELTGNAKAELWAWYPLAASPTIVRLDKATGATLQTITPAYGAGGPTDWAWAWWGGDFWIFLKKGADPATVVYQVDATTGAVKSTINTNSVGVPRNIVGAGVSTCAPVVLL